MITREVSATSIHALSAIHPEAKIGKNVKIGPFVTIEADTIIGDGCEIMANAVICSGTRLGRDCRIFPGAVLGAAPQDLKYKGEPTTLEIGDKVIIREFCTLNRGTSATGKTIVGEGTLLMAYCHIAHDCIVGKYCVFANNATLAGHVEVEDYVIIGGMVAVQQFLRIGAYSMLGGGTLHNKDVPPFIRVAHYPASYIGVNSIGLRRRGFADQDIRQIQDLYHRLFVKHTNRKQALQEIENEVPDSPFKQQILAFVQTSQVGLLKGLRTAE